MLYYYIGKYPVWVKDEPSVHGKNINVIKEGEYVSCKTIKNNWMELSKGYVYILDSDGNKVFTNDANVIARRRSREDMTTVERFTSYEGEEEEERTSEDYSQDYPEEGKQNSYSYTVQSAYT